MQQHKNGSQYWVLCDSDGVKNRLVIFDKDGVRLATLLGYKDGVRFGTLLFDTDGVRLGTLLGNKFIVNSNVVNHSSYWCNDIATEQQMVSDIEYLVTKLLWIPM